MGYPDVRGCSWREGCFDSRSKLLLELADFTIGRPSLRTLWLDRTLTGVVGTCRTLRDVVVADQLSTFVAVLSSDRADAGGAAGATGVDGSSSQPPPPLPVLSTPGGGSRKAARTDDARPESEWAMFWAAAAVDGVKVPIAGTSMVVGSSIDSMSLKLGALTPRGCGNGWVTAPVPGGMMATGSRTVPDALAMGEYAATPGRPGGVDRPLKCPPSS